MAEPTKHKCTVLVCPGCGKKYSAKAMELLVFAPFNIPSKGKRQAQE